MRRPPLLFAAILLFLVGLVTFDLGTAHDSLVCVNGACALERNRVLPLGEPAATFRAEDVTSVEWRRREQNGIREVIFRTPGRVITAWLNDADDPRIYFRAPRGTFVVTGVRALGDLRLYVVLGLVGAASIVCAALAWRRPESD